MKDRKDHGFPEINKTIIPFPADIPREVRQISKVFTDAGIENFLTGGSVRDMVLGRTADDYDLAVAARPNRIIPLLQKNGIEYDDQYIDKVDYVIAIINDFRIDLITYKGNSIEEHVRYLDFTLNALVYDIENESILDFFSSMEDIRRKKIRLIAPVPPDNPAIQLRAIRFALQFGFKIDSFSYEQLTETAHNIIEVRLSNIRKNIFKIYDHCSDALT